MPTFGMGLRPPQRNILATCDFPVIFPKEMGSAISVPWDFSQKYLCCYLHPEEEEEKEEQEEEEEA